MAIDDHSRTGVAPRALLRFDRVQRGAHWANAVLFTVLIATAIPLYFGSFFGVVLQRHSVQLVHLWTGIALPLPLVVSLLGPWGRRMRRDIHRFNYWSRDEVAWLRSLGKSRLSAEKFNPGQKLNAVFIAASILVMLVTGAILQWFRFFTISQREGATFVHDGFAFVIVVVIVGHLYMALTHRGSLRSMIDGKVTAGWAEQHAPAWLHELLDEGEISES
ncbi:MAG: cytochrome b/b6 domain-containing protein [Actinomycetota bacterium]|jgi:formate dehydrogenase subunit gamma|nr:cytochrome b/b6 domain-containing protein [Actinomycetota bacterium]